ncbi:bcpC [Symbiodinium pilosum]|uniref:BcpC protein n=1 Tax=Symbiodinium pilosum TaxID=2952 RepID=A0A812YDQ5_SYMPI|nr:bcpC [Symbiodinium pilosum]
MTETVRTYLNPAHFFMLLRAHGTSFFAGVPDSLLKDVCAYITDNVPGSQHVIAANEGTALAMAAGHYLATGSVACVYLQNSGLGNTINPLLSLCSKKVYAIPALLLIGWRGEPGKKDEPQHLLQGALTPTMLENMGVPYEILPDYAEGAFEVITKAYAPVLSTCTLNRRVCVHECLRKGKEPFALLVKKETFEKYRLAADSSVFSGDDMLHREEILEEIIQIFPSSPLVTTTGFTSREMFELRVQKGQSHGHDFLTAGGSGLACVRDRVGSMGHCSSIALGVALAQPQQEVLCIDGDGAALMHMGCFATIGRCSLSNFKHVLINNAVHDSVGGQPTGSVSIDFPAIAKACGYKEVLRARSTGEVREALATLKASSGPSFLEIQALPGARADLGRPTTSTHQNKEAFMKQLRGKLND